MATSGSEQLNNENLQPQTGENTQEAVAAGDAPPKSAKQLAKEAEKAEKLKKFAEKQKAKEEAEKKVPFTFRSNKKVTKLSLSFSRKRRTPKVVLERKKHVHAISPNTLHQLPTVTRKTFIVNYPKVIHRNTSKQLGIHGGTNKVSFVRNTTTNIRQRMHLEKISPWSFHHRMSPVIFI